MKNIRFLTQRNEKLGVINYAVFFEHDGFRARLDWSIHDSAEATEEHIHSLMLEQIAIDLSTDWVVEEIRAGQSDSTHDTDKNVKRFIDDGFVEQYAIEFKARAMARFGDQ